MEELKQIIITHWPTIVQYALMFVAYFLVFLYKNKITNTKTNLTTLFKDTVAHLSETETSLRNDISAQLKLSKAKYQAAVDEIADLKVRMETQEKVIKALIGGTYEETCTDADDETTDT